jgi:hypothetical protein
MGSLVGRSFTSDIKATHTTIVIPTGVSSARERECRPRSGSKIPIRSEGTCFAGPRLEPQLQNYWFAPCAGAGVEAAGRSHFTFQTRRIKATRASVFVRP